MPVRITVRRLLGLPEFYSALAMILWSKWVLFQPEDLSTLPNYQVLSKLLTDAEMEWIGFTLGALQLGIVLGNWRWQRCAVALASILFWGVLANGLRMANPSTPGIALHITMACMNAAALVLLCCRRPHE